MKRLVWIVAAAVAIIIAGVVLCVPLIENYEPEVQYYSSGYANTKGILRGLCTGEISECYSVIYNDPKDHGNIHPQYVSPELPEKLASYCQIIDGRHYKHTAAMDYTLEGEYPDPPYTETSYMEIILEDDTVLYATVVFQQNIDGCGVTDFDLYEECPWQE